MSKRTKLKVRNLHLFLAKNVFNSRYIVRNILALTILVTFAAVIAGVVSVAGGQKQDSDEKKQVASGSVEEIETLDGSVVSMDVSGTGVLRAELEAQMTADKEVKDKEIVAAAAGEFEDKFAANTDDVNVRAEASADAQIVGRMDTGACGDVLSQEDGWIRITSGEVTGYVSSDYVTVGEDAYDLAQQYYTATAVCTESGVNLRAEASTESEVIGAVYQDVTYTVAAEHTDESWVCIETGDDSVGYVRADYMEVTEGYRVAEAIDDASGSEETTEAEVTTESAGTTESKKTLTSEEDEDASGSVTEVKKPTQTTEAASTQKTTQTTAQTTQTTAQTTQTTAQTTQTTQGATTVAITTRSAVSLSDADINLMAAVMTLECGSESYEGQLAVANVILNRLQSGAYGNTISDVVYAANQFSVVSDSRFQGLVENGAQASCIQAAKAACAGTNNVGTFTSFRPSRNVDTDTLSDYTQIGNHVFFN